jgi:hypothetical protein
MDNDTYTQEKIMSNLTGFEIRANLLNQAEGILHGNIEREIQAIQEHNMNNPEDIKEIPVKKISAAAVISLARKLNEFVAEK